MHGVGIIRLVGEEKKSFLIHKDLAVAKSHFFASKLKDVWRNDAAKPVDLTQLSVHEFKHVVDWIYKDQISRKPYTNAYKVADFLMAEGLKNAILTKCVKTLSDGRHFNHASLKQLIGMELLHTKLFKMVLEDIALTIRGESKYFDSEHLSVLSDQPELMSILLSKISSYKERPIWSERDPCDFHEHQDGKRCSHKVTSKEKDTEKRAAKRQRMN